MMNEVSFEKFKNYIKVGEKFSANYFWNSKSQPDYSKFGGSGDCIGRGASDIYFTSIGENGNIRLYILKKCYSNKWLEIENDIHKYLRSILKQGSGGTEMYKVQWNYVEILHTYIFNNYKENYEFYVNTDTKSLRKLNPKSDKNYSLLYYEKLYDEIQICDLCNKKCEKESYKCICVDGTSGLYKNIYAGKSCFLKLKNNNNYIKSKIYQKYILNSLFNSNFNIEKYNFASEENEFIYMIDNVVDTFIGNYLINRQSLKSPIKYEDIDICEFPYILVEFIITFYICDYLFINKKSFQVKIDTDFLIKYNISKISIQTINSLIENSKYFQIGDVNKDCRDENYFEIAFNHPEINSDYLQKYFGIFKTTIPKKLSNNEDVELSSEQKNIILSTNPYISGCPGSGKSQIIKNMLDVASKTGEEILVVTPTHSSKELLLEKYKKFENITGIVIDAFNQNRKDIDKVDTLIVDEYGMLDIFQWYKITQIIEKYNIKSFHVFGDIYQLPSVNFVKETKLLRDYIHKISGKVEKNWRYDSNSKRGKFLLDNKTNFVDLDNLSSVFNVQNYNEQTILNLITNQDPHNILCYMNKTVEKINDIAYKNRGKYDNLEGKFIKHENCQEDICISKYSFCEKCIADTIFVINKNIKYTTYLPTNCVKIFDEEGYQNEIYLNKNEPNKPIYKSKTKEKHMFFNGETFKIRKKDDETYIINSVNSLGEDIKKYDDRGIEMRKIVRSLIDLPISLTYCQTVHKSQGKTFNNISFIVDSNYLQSDLVFTALTRSKNIDEIEIFKNVCEDNGDIKFKICNINSISGQIFQIKKFVNVETEIVAEFGKYKGQKWLWIKENDVSYVDWILTNVKDKKMTPKLRKFLES